MAGIYIHIPFCKSFCAYCDFYSVTETKELKDFADAIIKETILQSEYLEGESVETVYFGGGTPSLLMESDIERLLHVLGKNFKITEDPEITFEANPDDLTAAYLKRLRGLGINRISIGIQSWNERILKYLGRRHSARQSAEALQAVFDAGFENVSVDLMYGIPGTNVSDLREDLEKTFNFPLTHLSAYHLTVEEGTKLGKLRKDGRLKELDEETSISMFTTLGNECAARGFIHYEISNFAREGYMSRHNSAYWKQVPYLGLGPSAHSFNTISRQWNVSNLRIYMAAIKKGEVPFRREEIGKLTMFNEYIMTSLRTMWGIDLEYVERFYDKELHDYLVNLSEKYIRYGLMHRNKNTLVLTEQGKMISDNIVAELLMEL